MAAQDGTDGQDARDPGLADVAGFLHHLALTFGAEQHPPGGQQDQSAERIDHPVDASNQGDAGADQQRPKHQCAGDPVPEHPALILAGDAQLGEDDDEDKDVVDRQRLLEKVRGVIFGRRDGAVRHEYPDPEREARCDPHDHPQSIPCTRRRKGRTRRTTENHRYRLTMLRPTHTCSSAVQHLDR